MRWFPFKSPTLPVPEKYPGYGTPNIQDRSDPNGSGDLTTEEFEWLRVNPGRCPDCGGRLLAGPEGGAAQNFLCEQCLSRYNACGEFWVERIGRMDFQEARKCGIMPPIKIGISTFARKNIADPAKLIEQIRQGWDKRKPGAARTDLTKVVLVPIPTEGYFGRLTTATKDMLLEAFVTERAEGEDPYIVVKAVGYKPHGLRWLFWKIGLAKPLPIKADPVNFVFAVLYSADMLLENNGTRSGDFDWEVVAVVASDVEDQPMEPLTMARNWLEKPGGTFAPYDLKPTMESIYYWSNRVKV